MSKAANHSSSRPEDRLILHILHAVNILFCRVYHRLTIISPLQIPVDGPVIIVCNHISSLDPLFLQAACSKRLIVWMMASEYMQLPMLGWIFRTVGIIPVARKGRDTGPLRAAIRALEAGQVVGIFPEGEISTDSQLHTFQTGVALLAIKTNAVICPAYQDGTHRNTTMLRAYARPNRAFVTFGPPVEINRSNSSKNNLKDATAKIQAAVTLLGAQVEDKRLRDKFK